MPKKEVMNLFRLTRLVVALISYNKRDYKARYKMDLNEFLQLKAMEQQRVNFEMTYVDMTGDLISGLLLS